MEREETGKRINEFPDYFVSNCGRVKSTWYGKERLLKLGTNKGGYLHVTLCYNGKRKTYRVHRLVAKAFIPNPSGLPEVNHKDEIKTHNFVENLEGCDYSYNSNYGTRKERISAALLNRRDTSRPVIQLTLDGKPIATYRSINEAVRLSGMSYGSIWHCVSGITKKPRKFNWEFVS